MAKIHIIILMLTFLYGCKKIDIIDDPMKNKATYAPIESVHQYGYYNLPVPPSGFTAAIGWMQAIDIDGKGTPSKVEVDWMRLHAIINKTDTVLYTDEFNYQTDAMSYYGLYSRYPWFAGDRLASMPFIVENGMLIMHPDFYSNNVYHWWNTSRVLLPINMSRIWFESKVRITGNAGVQIGIDYWKNLDAPPAGYNVNNTEVGTSDWFGNSTADWQIISVGKP